MAYNYITSKSSPNFTKGRTQKISAIVIHWFGDPNTKPTASGVVSWFLNKASQVSAHYVITGTNREVYHVVDNANTAWHAKQANPFTIGLECDPRCRDEDYDVVAEVVANLWKHYGKLPLKRHSEYVSTACPGNYDIARIAREAEAKLNPKPAPAPAPVAPAPAKLVAIDIPNKMFIIKKETDLWDLSFTKWADAKSIKKYPSGTVIEISAIVDHPLGGRYLLTEYSFSKGIFNGVNVADVVEYKEPAKPVQPTPVEPEKPEVSTPEAPQEKPEEQTPQKPETDVNPSEPAKDDDLHQLQGRFDKLVGILRAFVDKLIAIFSKEK